ncbi:hypothetical protein AGLY_012551 [Aphis glycines]|uniref:Uncharacterized protein n=1 Tax=Aphis glycines TaxID=307491 RepID=A0A6G0T9A4_APHGL|nr:hypothetical protein AGLY_012551 [Aphis glycines]
MCIGLNIIAIRGQIKKKKHESRKKRPSDGILYTQMNLCMTKSGVFLRDKLLFSTNRIIYSIRNSFSNLHTKLFLTLWLIKKQQQFSLNAQINCIIKDGDLRVYIEKKKRSSVRLLAASTNVILRDIFCANREQLVDFSHVLIVITILKINFFSTNLNDNIIIHNNYVYFNNCCFSLSLSPGGVQWPFRSEYPKIKSCKENANLNNNWRVFQVSTTNNF